MVYFSKVLIFGLLAFGVACQAVPVQKAIEDNEIEREKRQMKGNTAQSVNAEQAEVKFVSPIGAAASGALQAVNSNLQAARQNGLFLPVGFAGFPGLGFGGVSGAGPSPGFGALGIGGSLSNGINPTGSGNFETYPHGLYPQMGLPSYPPQYGPLENGINLGNLQAQLVAQPSQFQAQIQPPFGPILPGYFPGYQNFQG